MKEPGKKDLISHDPGGKGKSAQLYRAFHGFDKRGAYSGKEAGVMMLYTICNVLFKGFDIGCKGA